MFRKILFFLLIVGAGVLIYFSYNKYEEVKAQVSEGFHAIPGNACFILESRQSKNVWKKLSETNILWADLLGTEFFNNLNLFGNRIDSVLSSVNGAYEMMNNHSVFISVHKNTSGSFDFLYTFSLPDLSKESVIDDIMQKACGSSEITKREYDDAEIKNVKFSQTQNLFYYTIHKGIFSGSFSGILIEDAIRQLNSGVPITNDKSLSKVLNTAGAKSDANFYINYKNFPEYVQTFLIPVIKKNISFFSDFAGWGELDVSFKPNALLMNGYTFASDSMHQYLGIFAKQKPQQIEITQIIPANTSTFLFFGVSSFKAFNRDYKFWLDSKNQLTNYTSIVEAVNKKNKINVEEEMLSWIDNEFALVITEPGKTDYSSNSFGVFRSNRITEAVTKLNSLSDSIAKKEKSKSDTLNFRGFIIKEFPLSKILGALLGEAFSTIESNYFTVVEDYVVFGKTEQAMKSFISDYGSGKTLSKNNYYNEFKKENLSDEANIFLYNSIARSPNLYKNFVADEFLKDIDDKLELFRKFEAVGIQLSADNGMFYQNIYLKQNPVYKKETTSLWETLLDTTITSKPALVINHNNQTKEIFVQDDANTIYLISNTGKILWKRKLDEKIMSEVFQIDKLRNEKLQMLFNTKTKIYLVDRNGKDVDGFPIKLKANASAGIAVFDYENSRNYRIVLPCDDKNVYNYTENGKPADKWKFDKTDAVVKIPLQHFNISGKDYLIALDASGKVYVVNRRGEKEIKPKEKVFAFKNNFFVETGKDLSSTYIITCDSLGNVQKLSLNNEKQNVKLKDFPTAPFFTYCDINGDSKKEYVFVSGTILTAYGQDKKLLFISDLKKTISSPAFAFNFSNEKTYLGFACAESREVYLTDRNGKTYSGFPLYGATSFSIGDINKDNHLYLVTAAEKSVYVYSLE